MAKSTVQSCMVAHHGKQSLWATAVMVQGTYDPLLSRYGPLQLWSSTHMGHILNGLVVDIGVVIGFKVGIGLMVGIRLRVGIGVEVGIGVGVGIGLGLGRP